MNEQLFLNLMTVIRAVVFVYYVKPDKDGSNSLKQMPKISWKKGSKYIKIINERQGSSSVYGFVRRDDGAIFRALSWRAPDLDHVKGYVHQYDVEILGAFGVNGESTGSYGVGNKSELPDDVQKLLP